MDRQNRTVLIVEDNSSVREAMADLLEDEGYVTVSASNGREALEYMRHVERPAVVLLDLMMPVMDGWRFREEQQGDPRLAAIPVVIVTADRDAQTRETTIRANAWLWKPFKIDRLLSVIRDCCALSPAGAPLPSTT
jgi:CheY-like chemotaxis protein